MIASAFYVDTSVVGGSFDKEFHQDSILFWKQAQDGYFSVLISTIVGRELVRAPDQVRAFFENTVKPLAHLIEITDEMEDLADEFLRAGAVGPRFRDDALHVAAASISHARALVSWNFHHLVNIRRESAFNSVNILLGYPSIRIVSPLEVIEHDEEL